MESYLLNLEKLKLKTFLIVHPAHQGKEGQTQQFLVWATFSSFSRPSHLEILVLQIFFLYVQPLQIKIKYENLATRHMGHKTWRMWLGRDIVVVGLPPLVHRNKQNMHNYAGPVDFLSSYYSGKIDCTSKLQANFLFTKQLICYILYIKLELKKCGRPLINNNMCTVRTRKLWNRKTNFKLNLWI